jgi:hypothetical protein
MTSEAERRFAVRIKIAVPAGGFGECLNQMNDWLDQNAGSNGWAMTPAGFRGVVNDAVTSISVIPRLPVPLWLDGAKHSGLRSWTAYSGSAMTSRQDA